MRKSKKQTPSGLQVPGDTSLVSCTTSCAQADVSSETKPARQPRRENTRDGRERMSLHSVFVLGSDGKPLTPTTPARARKLLKGGQAKKAWSKFGTFGIQMLVETRKETPLTVLGYDIGTRYEGIAVVSGTENVLAVKLDLPDKNNIVRKMEERRHLRKNRRYRKCRKRLVRLNRSRRYFLAPSQVVMVGSRLKVLGACFKIYPITVVGNEDVRFNHAKKRWGKNFSTIEIGKKRIYQFFEDQTVQVFDFLGVETEALRKKYEYSKTSSKSADKFTAHCSDALALACEVGPGVSVKPGKLLVVLDSYRPIKRHLHKTQFLPGGFRGKGSCGTMDGVQKGALIGVRCGNIGLFCGKHYERYRYRDVLGKIQETTQLVWVSNNFLVRKGEDEEESCSL